MNLTEHKRGNVLIVALAGRLDAATAPDVADRLQTLVAANENWFVLDLSDVPYLASAGIRVLHGILREARRRSGDVRLAGVQPLVKRTLELVGLVPVLNIYDDVATALASFS